jgi:hypothetical protein
MVLTNSFIWDDLPTTNADGQTIIATMVPRIERTVKKYFMFVSVFHGGYIIVRTAVSEHRQLTTNTFYYFDVSSSPLYELIFVSQVRPYYM